eukprot:Sdes_comp15065_c0_seq1m3848
MWQVTRIIDQAKNMVMNYSPVEVAVREATNSETWGPSGTQMAELAKWSYSYVDFQELMGMLWKRMLEEKQWRHIYKSLLVLDYLLKNGSERVLEDSKSRSYDIRSLETFRFVDEAGKDQGINVREKAKSVSALLSDSERLREERIKARKNRGKYIGTGNIGAASVFGGAGSDSYDRNGYDRESDYRGGEGDYSGSGNSVGGRASSERYEEPDDRFRRRNEEFEPSRNYHRRNMDSYEGSYDADPRGPIPDIRGSHSSSYRDIDQDFKPRRDTYDYPPPASSSSNHNQDFDSFVPRALKNN